MSDPKPVGCRLQWNELPEEMDEPYRILTRRMSELLNKTDSEGKMIQLTPQEAEEYRQIIDAKNSARNVFVMDERQFLLARSVMMHVGMIDLDVEYPEYGMQMWELTPPECRGIPWYKIIYPWKGWRIQPKEIREALKWYDYAADLRPDIFVISEDVRYLVHDLVSYMRESLEYGGFKTNVADYI